MFQPAEKKKKYLKILVYGSSGNGKTHLALTFPKCAVIDTESGTDFFVGKPGIESFDVIGLRSYKDAVKEIEELETKGQGKYKTLVIDSITRIYSNLKTTGQQVAEDRAIKFHTGVDGAGLSFREWGIIKNRYGTLMDRIYNLPFNTVITCWIKDIYDGERKSGVTYDCDKSTEYQADIILRMEVDEKGTFWGIVEKDRTGEFPKMSKIKNPTFKTFEKVLAKYGDGAQSVLPSAEQAVEKDAGYFQLQEVQSKPVAPAVPLAKPNVAKKADDWTDEEKAEAKQIQEDAGISDEDVKKMFREAKGNKQEFFLALRGTADFRKNKQVQEVLAKEEQAKPADPPVQEETPKPVAVNTAPVQPIKPFKFTKEQSRRIKELNVTLKFSQQEMIRIWNNCDGDADKMIATLEFEARQAETQKAA